MLKATNSNEDKQLLMSMQQITKGFFDKAKCRDARKNGQKYISINEIKRFRNNILSLR